MPNPVAPDIINAAVPAKRRQVVAIGRWDDVEQKNTAEMIRVLCRFLRLRPGYRAVVIGPGDEVVRRLIKRGGASPTYSAAYNWPHSSRRTD